MCVLENTLLLMLKADSLEVAESKVDTACKKMLCNQIMESYSFKVSKY